MDVATRIETITVERAQEILGWEIRDAGDAYHFRDTEGQFVFCSNNLKNRPLYRANWTKLRTEILAGRWRLNGEPVIIGEFGSVLNGQHTLIALCLAAQERELNPDLYDYWDEEPYIEKVVTTGICEDDEIINTLDTCRPRSFGDCIFRSDYFSDITKPAIRKKISKVVEFAVREVWSRTGKKDPFSTQRTHSESMDFIEKHPRILECVRFCFETNDGLEKYLERFLSLGAISGLHYLMSTSHSSDSDYYQDQTEYHLNFQAQESAEEFWRAIATNDKHLSLLRKYLSPLGGLGNRDKEERTALICKAWEAWSDDKPIDDHSLHLEYGTNESGKTIVIDNCSVGGIDLGNKGKNEDDEMVFDLSDRIQQEKKQSLRRKRLSTK